MEHAAQRDREEIFRADVARLVQAMHHHLPADDVPPEVRGLLEPVQRLASLLEAGAPVEHLQEAALAVVDSYDWPSPEASGGGEGPAIDGAILAAVERLRDGMDTLDELDEDDDEGDEEGDETRPDAGLANSRAGPGRGYDEWR